MKNHFSCLFLVGLMTLMPFCTLLAREELIVIQTVSNNRRSFVVAKGIKDGVVKGQEIIFANENVSIVCKASEVNRAYSLWVPVDKTITVPFNKEDIVSSNSTVYGNVALDIIGDTNLTLTENFNIAYKKFRTSNNFAAKVGLNRGLGQSSSEVSDEKNTARKGYNFAIDYNYRFLPEFEMSFGARIDNEFYTLVDPELDIPTNRILATISATYHFVNFSDNKNNYYLTIATGIGRSQTTVNDETSSGPVTILPEVKVGFVMPFTKSMAMIIEGSVESISTVETFSDGTEQSTNMMNIKASVGLRF